VKPYEKDGFHCYGPPEWCDAVIDTIKEARLDAKAEILAQRMFRAIQSNRVSTVDPTPEELLESLRQTAGAAVRRPEGGHSEAVREAWMQRYLKRKAEKGE
jgi:hypothetical protein